MAYGKIKKARFYDEMHIKEIDENYLTELYRQSKEFPQDSPQAQFTNAGKIGTDLPGRFFQKIDTFFLNMKSPSRALVTVALLLVLSGIMAAFIIGQSAMADKDKDKELQVEGENKIMSIGSNSGTSEDGAGIDEYNVDTWEEVEHLKMAMPELLVPQNLPEVYDLKRLKVEKYPNGTLLAEYVFDLPIDKIMIISQFSYLGIENPDKNLLTYDEILIDGDCTVYITNNEVEQTISGFFFNQNSKVNVSGMLSKEEVLNIIMGIQQNY